MHKLCVINDEILNFSYEAFRAFSSHIRLYEAGTHNQGDHNLEMGVGCLTYNYD